MTHQADPVLQIGLEFQPANRLSVEAGLLTLPHHLCGQVTCRHFEVGGAGSDFLSGLCLPLQAWTKQDGWPQRRIQLSLRRDQCWGGSG